MCVAREGHYTAIQSTNRIGEGVLNRFTGSIHHTIVAATPDLIIFDNPADGKIATQLKARGYKTLFASQWSSALNKSKEYNLSILSSLGFDIADDNTQGYALTVEGWYNGNEFVSAIVAIIFRKLLAGDLGPTVDYMGSAVYGNINRHTKLYKETLGKLEVVLRKVDYCGPVSIDIALSDIGVWAIALHANPRIPTTPVFFEGTKVSVSAMLLAIASGHTPRRPDFENYIISVGMSLPPWPYSNRNATQQPISLSGISEANLKHLRLQDVFMDEKGDYYCPMTSGFIGSVTARGRDVREARRRAYRTLGFLEIPDLQYRNDIGLDSDQVFQNLKSWEYLG